MANKMETMYQIGSYKRIRRRSEEPLPLYARSDINRRRRPAWFNKLVRGKYQGAFPCFRWADHVGSVGDRLTFEPYGLESDDVRELISFCDDNQLDYHVSALCQWYPTRTVLIQIWPRGSR